MADSNPKVMEMVQAELKKNPDASNEELRRKAESLDKGIAKLSARQFNASYPLQVKRAMAPPRKRTGRKRGKATTAKRSTGAATTGARRGRKPATARASAAVAGGDHRDQVRKVLVQLARDVAEGDRGALVEVAAGIDRYVDRVLKATS